jgi:hypothetical protein
MWDDFRIIEGYMEADIVVGREWKPDYQYKISKEELLAYEGALIAQLETIKDIKIKMNWRA